MRKVPVWLIWQTNQVRGIFETEALAEQYKDEDMERYPGPRNDSAYMRIIPSSMFVEGEEGNG